MSVFIGSAGYAYGWWGLWVVVPAANLGTWLAYFFNRLLLCPGVTAQSIAESLTNEKMRAIALGVAKVPLPSHPAISTKR